VTSVRSLLWPAVATAALGVALLLAPGVFSTWMHVYLVVVCAGSLAVAVRALARNRATESRSVFHRALAPRRERDRKPEDLEHLERLVTIASASAFDVHYRLRPALREIAAGILLGRGIDLDARPEAARAALGDDAWELLRPDRPPPVDRQARGIAPAELEAVVRAMEVCR
jgi:hypothetical protein